MFWTSSKSTLQTEEQKEQFQRSLEIQVLSFYGIPANSYQIMNVVVFVETLPFTIHTFTMGNPENPTIVLLHGYGGTFAHYSKIFNQLSQKFYIVAIDLPGMGSSSKEHINISNYEETRSFFTGTIEAWRIQMKLDSFILVGHSFGGYSYNKNLFRYVSAQYTLLYPQYVRQLILLSPAGSTKWSQEEREQEIVKMGWRSRLFLGFARFYWDEQMTIKDLQNKIYGPFFLKRYLQKRMGFQGQEYEIWKQYNDYLLSLPNGSERAIFSFFDFPLFPIKSIQELFDENFSRIQNIPIKFYFGANDWMNSEGAKYLKEKYSEQIKMEIIPNAGHQMIFENPKEVFKMLQSHCESIQGHSQEESKEICLNPK